MPMFYRHAQMGSIAVVYNYANEVWQIERGLPVNGRQIPSFASIMAGQGNNTRGSFRVDYAFDLKTVPKVSASDVIEGKIDPSRLAGKIVIVGSDAWRQYDQFMIPGQGKFGGVYVHIIAAETLMKGPQHDLGWFPSLLVAIAAVLLCFLWQRANRPLILSATAALLLLGPIALEANGLFVDITPGLFLVCVISGVLGWRHFKQRGLVNPVSGLPNLNAFKRARDERDRPIIAARVLNFAQVTSTMSASAERDFVEQIVKRLGVGSQVTRVYQGDDGIFGWTIDQGTSIGHHVEALHALFRSPARVQGDRYDIAITFGVEVGSGRSMANRFGSALVAADEAASEGLKWKYHDPERLRDAGWRLSLLAQLDDAIDNGEVWVAYQPQLDLATGTVRGAEALARWTHPEKGPISPSEFVAAAEHHDRIEKLTFFVLDAAVAAASKVNQRHGEFDMAVNLSARLLHDKRLPMKVKAVLDRYRLDPARLTLELTETAAMTESGADIDCLVRLRDIGVRISIDDYGTGLSTLEYLKKIPATEIKIDQSFVKSMRDNRSDMVMVQSTIALAHSLGRSVVAEGVETHEAMDLLVAMKCDVAQGFIIGRPTSLEGLIKRIGTNRSRVVA
jgi:EAL domain-containing protein (putative c-di-GMP-specific phosphodiesterase class I)